MKKSYLNDLKKGSNCIISMQSFLIFRCLEYYKDQLILEKNIPEMCVLFGICYIRQGIYYFNN